MPLQLAHKGDFAQLKGIRVKPEGNKKTRMLLLAWNQWGNFGRTPKIMPK